MLGAVLNGQSVQVPEKEASEQSHEGGAGVSPMGIVG